MREGKQDIRSLTSLRGVAALFVVCYHYTLGLKFTNPLTTFVGHGYLAVDLFFVLSGFVMALSYRHMFAGVLTLWAYGRFLSRRIARVYPLYLLTTLVGFALVVAGSIHMPGSGSLGAVLLQNLFMVQAWGFGPSLDPPGWSISTELAAYLLFPLLLRAALSRRGVVAWAAGILSVLTLVMLCRVPAALIGKIQPEALLDIHTSYAALAVVRCLAEFLLGLLAFRWTQISFGRMLTLRSWPAAAICLAIAVCMTRPRADLLIVMLFPLLIVSLSAGRQLPTRVLGWGPLEALGRWSYSIYLVHDLMGGLIGWVHQEADLHGKAHGQTYGAAVALLVTMPLAWLAYTLVEVPGRHWLRTLLEGEAVANRPAAVRADLQPEPGEF